MVLLLAAAGAGTTYWYRQDTGPQIVTEAIRARDLEAIVSASGKIQPKRQVNISANTMGKVTRLAVEEGQRVKAGQFLLEIDPRSLAGQLAAGRGQRRGRAVLAAAGRTAVEQARAIARPGSHRTCARQQELWKDGLTTQGVARAGAERGDGPRGGPQGARSRTSRHASSRSGRNRPASRPPRYNLNQVIISSPMDGLVTRRNIEEGETVVVGTMNNAGTVLLTIADMSVLEAEIEVDETDIPNVHARPVGQGDDRRGARTGRSRAA